IGRVNDGVQILVCEALEHHRLYRKALLVGDRRRVRETRGSVKQPRLLRSIAVGGIVVEVRLGGEIHDGLHAWIATPSEVPLEVEFGSAGVAVRRSDASHAGRSGR